MGLCLIRYTPFEMPCSSFSTSPGFFSFIIVVQHIDFSIRPFDTLRWALTPSFYGVEWYGPAPFARQLGFKQMIPLNSELSSQIDLTQSHWSRFRRETDTPLI